VSLKGLTEPQQKRLQRLRAEIQIDKITVSFSIEDRDLQGRKLSAFYASTASRGHTSPEAPSAQGWSLEDTRLVSCMVSKEVVIATYRDAVRRRILSSETAKKELAAILPGYDDNIRKLLEK
jgi:hypothetical protein